MSGSPAASGREEPGGAQRGSPVPPPPYGAGGPEPGLEPGPELELRGALDCLACAVLLSAHNLLAAALCALLCALLCAAALLPAGTALGLGFLCHSKFLHARVPRARPIFTTLVPRPCWCSLHPPAAAPGARPGGLRPAGPAPSAWLLPTALQPGRLPQPARQPLPPGRLVLPPRPHARPRDKVWV